MTKQNIDITGLDLINGNEAIEILDFNYKSQLKNAIEKHKVPHQKISRNWIFLRSDIEFLKNQLEENPRKNVSFNGSVNISTLDLIGMNEAMEIFEIQHKGQMINELIPEYEIPHKKFLKAYVFLRSDVEAKQNSPERQEKLKHRKKKK